MGFADGLPPHDSGAGGSEADAHHHCYVVGLFRVIFGYGFLCSGVGGGWRAQPTQIILS